MRIQQSLVKVVKAITGLAQWWWGCLAREDSGKENPDKRKRVWWADGIKAGETKRSKEKENPMNQTVPDV